MAYLMAGTVEGAAERLGDVTPRTVEAHLDVCRRKLGAWSVRSLLEAALREGIIRLEVV